MSRLNIQGPQEEFIDPRHRKPEIGAEADVTYERMLRAHSEENYGLGGPNYFAHPNKSHNFF